MHTGLRDDTLLSGLCLGLLVSGISRLHNSYVALRRTLYELARVSERVDDPSVLLSSAFLLRC
jgi:hypothetical protein